MKYFKNGKTGWWMGERLTVVSRRKWNGRYVYAIRYRKSKSLDYFSHAMLLSENVFKYNFKGEYTGVIEP